ncbi:PAS domain-containing protein [Anaerolineales bacterium HSG6]|nr:PAS domain-containing protein [Anaerolineales bacterium HSG6]
MSNDESIKQLQQRIEQLEGKIANQAEMHEEFRQSKRRMELALESTNTGLWDWNIAENKIYFSPRYYTMLGHEPYEMPAVFDTWKNLLHPDDVEMALTAVTEYHTGQRPDYVVEFRMKTKSGAWRWILARGEIIERDDESNPIRMIGTHVDITVQKQAEAEQVRLQQEVIKAQQHAIQELSTPIIPMMDGIIVMPLIGSIDSLRAKDLMRTLLTGISDHRAKIVILDITGVTIVDTGIAAHLDKTIQAARLKGARTIVTGISDAVAETIIDLGIDWSNIETVRDLQTGLMVALDSLGMKLR